jgi:hypothetical protein
MMTNEFNCDVEIVIRGRAGAGKSHVGAIVGKALRDHGVSVTVSCGELDTLGELGRIWARVLDGVHAGEGSKASIREVRVSKGAQLHNPGTEGLVL